MRHARRSPNLFDYATKELSQDAVICWLLAWAGTEWNQSPEHEALRQCGRALVAALFEKWADYGAIELGDQVRICIRRQEKNIDVLARVDDRRVLLIEDKTDTGTHDDQLGRYVTSVLGGKTAFGEVSWDNLYPIYLKTGNQSLKDRSQIEDQGYYRVFDRADFLEVLDSYRGGSDILLDFRRHLTRWQRETESFRQWTKEGKGLDLGWEGFYMRIEEDYLDRCSDDYGLLTTHIGGYTGLWMVPKEASANSRFEIWIEQNRVSFRLCGSVEDMERKKWYWADAFQRGDCRFDKPRRLTATKTKPMCVSEWRGWIKFRNTDGRLDIEGSIKNIDRAKQILLNTIRNG